MALAKTFPLLMATSLVASTSCISRSGGNLEPIEISPPATKPRIEYSVGYFTVSVPGHREQTMSEERLGRWLSREILTRWARDGLADMHEVESPERAGTADYHLVFSGSGSEHSRAALGFLQALTALTLPVTYTDTFEIACRLEHAETGQRFRARAEETVRRTESLLLIPALPWHQSGYRATFDVLASHLYQQLVDQGAFETAILRGSGDSEGERRRRAPRRTDLRGEALPPDAGRVLAEILAESEEELARVEQATESGASYGLDVDPESIKNVRRFEEVLSTHPDVLRWRGPPESSSYHIVIRRGRR